MFKWSISTKIRSGGKRANRRHKNVNLHFGAEAAEKRKSKRSPGKVVSTSAKGKRCCGTGCSARGQKIASNVSKSERHLAMLLFIFRLPLFCFFRIPFFCIAPSNKHWILLLFESHVLASKKRRESFLGTMLMSSRYRLQKRATDIICM